MSKKAKDLLARIDMAKELRSQGHTNASIAEIMGVNRQTITAWFKKEKTDSSVAVAERSASFYDDIENGLRIIEEAQNKAVEAPESEPESPTRDKDFDKYVTKVAAKEPKGKKKLEFWGKSPIRVSTDTVKVIIIGAEDITDPDKPEMMKRSDLPFDAYSLQYMGKERIYVLERITEKNGETRLVPFRMVDITEHNEWEMPPEKVWQMLRTFLPLFKTTFHSSLGQGYQKVNMLLGFGILGLVAVFIFFMYSSIGS